MNLIITLLSFLITVLQAPASFASSAGSSNEKQFLHDLLDVLTASRNEQKESMETLEELEKTASENVDSFSKELDELQKKLKVAEEKQAKAKGELKDARARKQQRMRDYLQNISQIANNVIESVPGQEDCDACHTLGPPEITLFSDYNFTGAIHRLGLKNRDKVFTPEVAIKSLRIRNARILMSLVSKPEQFDLAFNQSVANLDERLPNGAACCGPVKMVSDKEDFNAVYLYSEEDFEGESKTFATEGDYDVDLSVRSVQVLAGYRLKLFERPNQDGYLTEFWHDNASPGATTAKKNSRTPKNYDVKSIKITKEDRVGATLRYYGNRDQLFPADPGAFTLPTWATPDLISVDQYATVAIHTEHGDEWYAPDEPLKPPVDGKMIYIDGKCSEPGYCSSNGRCVGNDECVCFGGYSGQRCMVQIPDATSSIVCDSLAAFVNEPLQCYFIPRKDNAQCTTNSIYIRLLANEEPLMTYDSPVAKEHKWTSPPDYEADHFPFKVVSTEVGYFDAWADLRVMHQPPGTYGSYFQPTLLILYTPEEWEVANGQITFESEIPSSADILLESGRRVPIPLSPTRKPLTESFQLLEPFSGEACLSLTIVGEQYTMGCKQVDYVVDANDSTTGHGKISTVLAWSLLRMGRWEDAIREARKTRDPEVITVAQLAIGLIKAAKNNARLASSKYSNHGKFDFFKSCEENKCPIAPLSEAYPAVPWQTSVPVVSLYEEKCAQSILSKSYLQDSAACLYFSATCEEVIHLLSKESHVTILSWAGIIKQTDLFEARRLLAMMLSVASSHLVNSIIKMLQDVDQRIHGGGNVDAEEEARRKEEEERKKKADADKDPLPDVPKDYYKLLQIERTATNEEIKDAYHKLALKWHPDKNPSPHAHDMFMLIKKAYETLINPAKRKKYDAGEETEDQPRQVIFEEEIDRVNRKRRTFWFDPETGESGSFEEDLGDEPPPQSKDRPTARHCCLEKPKKKK